MEIKKVVEKMPPWRLLFMAEPGWGKTTLLAHMPNPLMVMAKGETGYLTLASNGSVPQIPHVTATDWQELLAFVRGLASEKEYKVILFDALDGFAQLCYDYVCETKFGGDWGEKGFLNFHKGFDISSSEWVNLLSALETLWDSGKAIVLAEHVQVRNHKNPMGPDFDKYVPVVHQKLWAPTERWVDSVLFGKFQTILKEDPKTKDVIGVGGASRVLYTTNHDAYTAKNRYSMPSVIQMPDDPAQMWATVAPYLMKGKKANG